MIKNNLLRKQYTLNETNYQLKIPMELDACERMPSEKYASPEIMLKIMLYAYHERKDVSSRTIEKNCKRDINYMYLLEGRKAPDHAAIARFRMKHFAKCARHFMAQMTKFLIELEQVTTSEVFIDGTKIESAVNRYTFVWKKSVTKHPSRFLQKTALLVGDIIQRQGLKPLWQKQVKKKHVKKILKKLRVKADQESLEVVCGRGHKKTQLQRDIEALEAALEKLKEYEKKLHICANRGSYAKTDPDATFMHMKDDHMLNGQLKPAYNIQHAVNSGFIVAAGIFPNPTDVMTLKPFLNQMEEDLSFTFERVVCDAGYESEENLSFLRTKRIEAYIKPANYEQIGTKKFAKEIDRKENMQYDKEKDCYRCHIIPSGTGVKTDTMDRMDEVRSFIKDNIDYDVLLQCHPTEKMDINELVELMVETIAVKQPVIRINKYDFPYDVVRSRLEKIDFHTMEYVLECLRNNTTKVRNIRSYMLTTLYNAPVTCSNYYKAEVNHDFYGK